MNKPESTSNFSGTLLVMSAAITLVIMALTEGCSGASRKVKYAELPPPTQEKKTWIGNGVRQTESGLRTVCGQQTNQHLQNLPDTFSRQHQSTNFMHGDKVSQQL